MKKAPKGIKRKKYQAGGDVLLDEKGNPIPSENEQKARALGNQAGNALGAYGSQYFATKDNVSEGDSMRSAGLGAIGRTGAIGGAVAGIAGIADQFAKPTRTKSEKVDSSGELVDEEKAKRNAKLGIMFSPSQRLSYKGGLTDVSGDAYVKSIEEPYKMQIEADKKEAQKKQLEEALAARERGETGYTSINTYKPREFAKGGEIKGKGTGTSDSINAEVKEGSFVVPEKHAHMGKMIKEALGKKKHEKADLHQKGEDTVHVKLSNGEILFTPEEKEEIEKEMGEEILEMLAPEAEEHEGEEGMAKGGNLSAEKARKILHDKMANGKPLTDKQRRYMGWVAGGRKMATGGEVDGGKITSKKPETTTTKSVAKKTYKTKPFVPREYMEPIKPNLSATETQDALREINNVNSNAVDTNPVSTKPAETKNISSKSNFWDKVQGINTDGLGSAIANYAFAAHQISEGKKGLKDTRPVSELDPTFLENVNTAQKNAKFGFTPEQQFLLDQQNQNLLNADRFAARNYAGGSGGNAFNMERSASNNAFMRSLQNASANIELQQGKQQFAAQLAAQKAQMNRNIFEDALLAYNQKQTAAGQLMRTGYENIADTSRFANYMRLRAQENAFSNKYNI